MENDITAEQASAEAIHKAKNAQQAIELARAAQMYEAVEMSAQKTRSAMVDALKEVMDENRNIDTVGSKSVNINVVANDIAYIKRDVAEIKDKLEGEYVTKAEFAPVKMLIFGAVGLVLTSVVGALITLVIIKPL